MNCCVEVAQTKVSHRYLSNMFLCASQVHFIRWHEAEVCLGGWDTVCHTFNFWNIKQHPMKPCFIWKKINNNWFPYNWDKVSPLSVFSFFIMRQNMTTGISSLVQRKRDVHIDKTKLFFPFSYTLVKQKKKQKNINYFLPIEKTKHIF